MVLSIKLFYDVKRGGAKSLHAGGFLIDFRYWWRFSPRVSFWAIKINREAPLREKAINVIETAFKPKSRCMQTQSEDFPSNCAAQCECNWKLACLPDLGRANCIPSPDAVPGCLFLSHPFRAFDKPTVDFATGQGWQISFSCFYSSLKSIQFVKL